MKYIRRRDLNTNNLQIISSTDEILETHINGQALFFKKQEETESMWKFDISVLHKNVSQ